MSRSSPILLLAELLLEQRWLMATAESCTGGLVASQLTAVAGASHWFDHSVVSYSYLAKQQFLAVQEDTLNTVGAVSAECVEQMVSGLLLKPQVDAALAISGIAGPDGGTVEKPVGTVWFAFAKKNHATVSVAAHFKGDREAVRVQASAFAIKSFYHYLQKLIQ
jgi:nicotinamide-nucleotide amidase